MITLRGSNFGFAQFAISSGLPPASAEAESASIAAAKRIAAAANRVPVLPIPRTSSVACVYAASLSAAAACEKPLEPCVDLGAPADVAGFVDRADRDVALMGRQRVGLGGAGRLRSRGVRERCRSREVGRLDRCLRRDDLVVIGGVALTL